MLGWEAGMTSAAEAKRPGRVSKPPSNRH
jgi:hypothetical protein